MANSKPNLDHELITRIKKDDHDSFQKLFERYSVPLFRFSFSYLKSKEVAEDVVQEVFMKVWNNRKSIKSNTSFQSYLFTIALNVVRKHFNKLSRNNELKHNILLDLAENKEEFDDRNGYQFLTDKLDEFIKLMPDKRREVFIKKKIEEKSLKEIAEECEITTKTVEYHITESMKFLKREFEKLQVNGIVFFYLFVQK